MEAVFLSFYRKYRPQTLQDLIGQDPVKNVLLKAFKERKLSHAYLFCGPRGTGKTSTARILAKMVNCESLEASSQSSVASSQTEKGAIDYQLQTTDSSSVTDLHPCNICSQCLSITDGSNLDLIEIDAASNRGIDDMRSLRENIKLSPTKASKKVYIIDEVHMLTNEAFNALLKTLEEPPAHCLFILATTEVHKIPQTILSRVQKLDFKLATQADLLLALKKAAGAEKIDIEDEALILIAKRAEGSFRDCLKLLDQVASGTEKITLSVVEQAISSGNFEDIFSLVNSLARKDAKKSLQIFFGQTGKGINIKEYILAVLDLTRMVMLAKYELKEMVIDSFGEEKAAQVIKLSDEFTRQDLTSILENFQEAYENLKFASIVSLPVELAIVESCEGIKVSSQLSVAGSQTEESVDSSQLSVKATDYRLQTTDSSNTGRDDSLPITDLKMVIVGQDSGLGKVSETGDLPVIIDKWNYILETIRPHNYSLEALLRSVRVLECGGGMILVEVPYAFHQRILETPKSRDLLESVVSDVLGKPTKLKTVIGKRPKRLDELQNVEIAADDEIIKIASEIFNSDGP